MADFYETALDALYSELHQSRTKAAIEAAAARRTSTISDMREYMRRCNLQLPTTMKIVHVTGTKGKGSTSALCETILRKRYQLRTGLFTSPHLVDIRERIRINGRPVSRAVFATSYHRLRERLESYKTTPPTEDSLPVLPGYFRMLTLMAVDIFSSYAPALDVVVLEVGMGGRYDATNILDQVDYRTACGVTLIDLDHTRVLGSTLEAIGWEKGGIFARRKGQGKVAPRPPYPADTMARRESLNTRRFYVLDSNTPSVVDVFRQCADVEGEGAVVEVVGGDRLPSDLVIGLAGDHQRQNAALAAALCEDLMSADANQDLGLSVMYQALSDVEWPGRCQRVAVDASTTLCLDGAHTLQSLQAGLDWFVPQGDASAKRALVFNCSHERQPVELLQLLVKVGFVFVAFGRAESERPSAVGKPSAEDMLKDAGIGFRPELAEDDSGTWQSTLATVWKHLDDQATVVAGVTAGEAIAQAKAAARTSHVHILVTGSLYLVGAALTAIGWTEEEADGGLGGLL